MEFLIFIVLDLVVAIPCWKIVGRAGFNPIWSLLHIVPLVNIVALWLFAVKDWPIDQRQRGR